MPELPEVESLTAFLGERAVGRTIAGVDVVAFQALKTFDPPVTALGGLTVTGVSRHGKFLDLDCDGLHLVIHLARAGWLRWRDDLSGARPVRPGKGPLAVRVRLAPDADGLAPGFELTEAGTQKRLAVYVVKNPDEVPGVAALGPDSTSPSTSPRSNASSAATAPRSRACCATRRSSPASATPTPTRCCTPPRCPRSRSRRR
ncbi:DNA-formamidopyrimidine glycosylase family protein [Nonomuraea ferruginea]|uniref:DNA-formamidopyrimidine glycosylase family protein n=1 Tax=Nonomuraea ferruginea TaxID=46174 RepID=UPI003612CAB1